MSDTPMRWYPPGFFTFETVEGPDMDVEAAKARAHADAARFLAEHGPGVAQYALNKWHCDIGFAFDEADTDYYNAEFCVALEAALEEAK